VAGYLFLRCWPVLVGAGRVRQAAGNHRQAKVSKIAALRHRGVRVALVVDLAARSAS